MGVVPPRLPGVLLSLALLLCLGGSTDAGRDAPNEVPRRPETECDRFNRDQAQRARNHTGRCPHCPCFCREPREIVCAPCARCEPGPRPTPDEWEVPPRLPKQEQAADAGR
jgi:hypothetical protein